MVFDFYLEKLPNAGVNGDEDSPIDIWSIPHGTCDSLLFYEDALLFAQLGCVDFPGNLIDC
jgi:hypothetical protein